MSKQNIKDYEVKITIKNNLLLHAMRDAGIETGSELSIRSGATLPDVYGMLALKITPYKTDGELRVSVKRVCDFLNVSPSDIFPQQHMNEPLKSNTSVMEANIEEIARISIAASQNPLKLVEKKEAETSVRLSLSVLRERDRLVIEHAYGMNDKEQLNFTQIGAVIGVCGQRARQIHDRALRRLKQKPVVEKFQLEHHKNSLLEST